MYSLALVMAAAVLVTIIVPVVRATKTEDRIESSFKNSFVYKTCLKDDHIKINPKVVSLLNNLYTKEWRLFHNSCLSADRSSAPR